MGATTAGAQRQKVVTVSIRDFYFEPSQLRVEPGTTVQWVNEGSSQHSVMATSPAGAFRSEPLSPGESFRHTFPQRFPKASPDSRTKRGTYNYYCQIHPDMRASVTFSESGGEAPANEREAPPIKPPPTVPRGAEAPTNERQYTTVQQPPSPAPPPASPETGGLEPPPLLIGLLVVAAVGVLGWAVKRRFS
jgi:plastocyanin